MICWYFLGMSLRYSSCIYKSIHIWVLSIKSIHQISDHSCLGRLCAQKWNHGEHMNYLNFTGNNWNIFNNFISIYNYMRSFHCAISMKNIVDFDQIHPLWLFVNLLFKVFINTMKHINTYIKIGNQFFKK
jgi:hypothetical protein